MLRDNQFVGNSPVPEISAGASRYRQMMGFNTPEMDYGKSVVAASASRNIGQAYMNMPDFDTDAVPAYKQMGEEVGRQFDHLTKPVSRGGMGIHVNVTDEDPYDFGDSDKNPAGFGQMKSDVNNRKQFSVLSTRSTGGHPIFSDDRNDMFRAVHDVFGHLGSGRAVDRHGEEAATQKHAAMFSPLAQQALMTETRGQNHALHLTGSFQDQKIGFLPHQYQTPGALGGTQFEMAQARNVARYENRKYGVT